MKNKLLKTFIILFLFIFQFIVIVNAHPGRTDSNGGHYDRSTGEYHYHNGESSGKKQSSSNETYTYENFVGPTQNYDSHSNSSNEKQNVKSNIPDLSEILFYLALGSIIIIGNYLYFKEKIEKRNAKKSQKEKNSSCKNINCNSNNPEFLTYDEIKDKVKQQREQGKQALINLSNYKKDETDKQ